MVLNVSLALKNPGKVYPFSFSEQREPFEVGGESVRFVKPVQISGTYVYTGEDFTMDGSIHAEYLAQCSRCLKDVPSVLDIPFSEEFARTVDEEHPDRYLYQGEKIDLEPMLGDLISLNTPMRHLCDQSCRGLCPVCGADRNTSVCGCHGGPTGENPTAAF